MKKYPLHTRVCDTLCIEYPILQGGMVWLSNWKLASAVSEAGGLGVLASGSSSSKAELKEEIKRVRDNTDKPFGINIPLMNPSSPWMIETALEENVHVVITSAGNPKPYSQTIKNEGLIHCHVVATPKQGKKAEESGVDIVIAEGIEAGGHNSPLEITTLVLVQKLVKMVNIPVIAAGGIATGRALLAMLALGAEGVQIGTKFILTHECPAHRNFKRKLLEATEEDTVLTARTIGHPVRCIKNKLTEAIIQWEKEGKTELEIIQEIGPGRSRMAALDGEVEDGTVMSGQCVGLVNEIKSVKEVINEIIREAEERLKELMK